MKRAVMKEALQAPPELDQIPIFPVEPEKVGRGGKRAGAGKPSLGGTSVVRVPNGCLSVVLKIIRQHKEWLRQPEQPPPERRAVKMKYRNPANPVEMWSGLGRKPMWFFDYIREGGKAEDLLMV